jgi:hypothetical protein
VAENVHGCNTNPMATIDLPKVSNS